MAFKPLCKLQYIAAAAAMIALLAMCQALVPDELIMADKHKKWMSEFGRAYKDEAEKATRFNVFRKNAAYIEAFNQQGNKTYTLGLNQFSDFTNQEFLASRTGYVSRRRSTTMKSSFKYAEATALPESIDWNKKGAVTMIRDQGQCGCCWIFSAIAAVEGIHKIKSGALISFSEQEILDCPTDKFLNGCNGDSPDSAFQYIIGKNGTMTVDVDYTYQGKMNDSCRSDDFERFNVFTNNIEVVPTNNESALMAAVAMQPVSTSIDANDPSFQFYKEGVYKGPCGTNLTHAVAVVGYGVDSSDGTNYWLLKNSWGQNWGDDGYMKLQKDVPAAEGLCGLAIEAHYPTTEA